MSLTLPSVSFLMNLYSKDVPAGTLTETVHTGYEAAESAICERDCVSVCGVEASAAHVAHRAVRVPVPELRDAADEEDVLGVCVSGPVGAGLRGDVPLRRWSSPSPRR